jgi:hypothetical protein
MKELSRMTNGFEKLGAISSITEDFSFFISAGEAGVNRLG